MAQPYPYVVTSDSIVVTVNGQPNTIQRTAPNYETVRQALLSQNWDEVAKNLQVSASLERWSKGNFKFQGDTVLYKGEKMPNELTERMVSMASAGESPEPFMKFWEKLQKNPSWRSVKQLFPFLKHQGIPIQPNGNFLAYKGVQNNYTDAHSGRVDNKPGVVNEMPRNKISDDPNTACHYGFHVGALEYARGFSQVVVVCEVDPTDVVCIPYDHSAQKMRVCRYKVIGNHSGEHLPSTSYELEPELGTGAEIEPETEELAEPEEKAETVQTDKKPEPKEKKLKKQRDENKRPKLKVAKEFKAIHGMTMVDLLKQPLGDLRTYASKVLSIVGASKIPGGKATLVSQILKVRKNFA